MRAAFFSILVSAGLALISSNQAGAAAANGAAASEIGRQSDPLIRVRDGCGRGRHFSKWRGICVWNRAPGPRYYTPPVYAPPPVYGPPVYGYGYYGPPVVYGPGYGYGYYRRW